MKAFESVRWTTCSATSAREGAVDDGEQYSCWLARYLVTGRGIDLSLRVWRSGFTGWLPRTFDELTPSLEMEVDANEADV